jgi:hypothetical protein
MNQIKTKLIIILLVLMSISYYGIGQPKYHTIPNIGMNTTSPNGINQLPWHYNDPQNPSELNPFIEADWDATSGESRYNAVKEKYLGQKPLFAHQIVNDKDGNLLFFIVDNNIYNKYGYAFETDPTDPTVKA